MDMSTEKEKLQNLKAKVILTTLYRLLLCSISFGTTLSAIGITRDLAKKGPVRLSAGLAIAVYSQDNETFIEDVYYLDDAKPKESVGNLNRPRINLAYNKENLSNIRELTIDALVTDFNDLLYCTNLVELTITNYACLDENDKAIINSLPNLQKINFGITFDILKLDVGADFSWVDDSIQIALTKVSQLEYKDLEEFYIYKIYDRLSENDKKRISFDFFTEERLEELKKWDRELSRIIETFGFNEETTDEEKIIEIVRYVLYRYEYDPEISEAVSQGNTSECSSEIHDYNINLLSYAFDEDNEYGICCNYAALTTILGEYSGLDVEYTSGTFGEPHAWCTYTDPTGEEFVIDTTYLDTSENLHCYLNLEDCSFFEDYIIDCILKKEDSYKNEKYVPDIPFEPPRVKADIMYVNEDVYIYNSKVMKTIRMHAYAVIIAFLLFELSIPIKMNDKDVDYKKKKEKTI